MTALSGKQLVHRHRDDGLDFYKTPSWATQALITNEFRTDYPDDNFIVEPCSGDGAISKEFLNLGFPVWSADIRRGDDVFGYTGKDFLTEPLSFYQQVKQLRCGAKYRHISVVTNPPFKYALPMLQRSLELATDRVCFFLKIQFLESAERYEFFKTAPLKKVLIFSSRVNVYNELVTEGENRNANGTMMFMWAIFQKGYTGKPYLEWIPPQEKEKKSRRKKVL